MESEEDVVEEVNTQRRSHRLASKQRPRKKKKIMDNSYFEEDDDKNFEEILKECQKVLTRKEDTKGDESSDTSSSTHVSDSVKNGPIELTQNMMSDVEEDVIKKQKGTCQIVKEGTCSKCLELEAEFARVKEKVEDIERKMGSFSRFGLRVMNSSTTALYLLQQNMTGVSEDGG
ncbi:hypothetical protein SUGI_0266660 [Cryptomeria japonica]|uniref:uncharacterized protein LOC131068471 n=1 Tax=Cryptomeria japonica TaxID=3369 RepID=UPI002408BC62|nr:uncharacterized protein LOC131068471 [Cryptomeria japonica]GLJ16054.1 hypothetical protein SUGI_0266660 [Cryptomeria japonica]